MTEHRLGIFAGRHNRWEGTCAASTSLDSTSHLLWRPLALLREIYSRKAAQDPASLFHDPCRVEFIQAARMGRNVVRSLRSGVVRAWRQPGHLEGRKFSPVLHRLVHPAMEAFTRYALSMKSTRQSLASGFELRLHDRRTAYKLRLGPTPRLLYRLHACPDNCRSE